jgi:hypothetical protein
MGRRPVWVGPWQGSEGTQAPVNTTRVHKERKAAVSCMLSPPGRYFLFLVF